MSIEAVTDICAVEIGSVFLTQMEALTDISAAELFYVVGRKSHMTP